MRILMLTDFYPPIVGGIERAVSALSRALVARGHEVSVATIAAGDLPEYEIDHGVHVYRLRSLAQRFSSVFSDPGRPFHPPAPDPIVTRELARLLSAIQPDVVHAHSWILYSFLPLKKRSGARLVVTLHNYELMCPKKDLLRGEEICGGPGRLKCLQCCSARYGIRKGLAIDLGLQLSSRLHRQVDQFLAVSSFVSSAHVEHGVPGDGNIPVVPSFLADDVAGSAAGAQDRPGREAADRDAAVSRAADDLGLPAGNFILFVGALGRHKGLGVLLEAYEGLGRDVPLVLIGAKWHDTPARFPSGVTVIEDAAHDVVMEAWRRCRLGVIPSVWPEPLGLVALEALAVGRPVVASRAGGLTDIVRHGETGLLVAPGNVEELRHATRLLLDDAELGSRLGRAGRQLVLDRFTASAVVPRIEEAYAGVTGHAVPPLASEQSRENYHLAGTPHER